MIIYLPEDVAEVLRLRGEAARCLKCDEPQPCVQSCPEQLDVATAVDIISRAIETAGSEGQYRVVQLPHDVVDSLRIKVEAGECLVCSAPQPCVDGCPLGIDVAAAMQIVAKAVVAGVPTVWDTLEPEAERDWVVG